MPGSDLIDFAAFENSSNPSRLRECHFPDAGAAAVASLRFWLSLYGLVVPSGSSCVKLVDLGEENERPAFPQCPGQF